MEKLQTVGRRYQRRRRALEATYAELVPLIREARRTQTLRAIASLTGLSFARIHQIEKERRD
jgi:hypothetical protein